MRNKINKNEKKELLEHLDHHVLHFYCKTHHVSHHGHHHLMHIWELLVIMVVWFMSLIFAWSIGLPNNSTFVYPLQQVSTYECRALMEPWENLDEDCKISLPKIQWVDYETYKDNSFYTSIYTVLRAAPYDENRDQKLGAHAWVDIASAKWTPLYSIWEGEVTYAWRQNWYGNVVKIKYLYQGKYVHAVYAHMDKIDVSAWQKVSAWVQVGTIGNSWNTFGALGWYHVHFELAKDNHGRPAYGYLWCLDLDKWHRKIIDNGLCREELFSHTYDPIYVFENQILDKTSLSTQPRSSYDIQEDKDENQDNSQNKKDEIIEQEEHNPIATEEVLDEIIEQKEKEDEEQNIEQDTQKDNHASPADEDQKQTENTVEKDITAPVDKEQKETSANKKEEKYYLIPEKEVSKEVALFLKKRDIYIDERIDNKINYTWPTTIKIVVVRKDNPEKKYIGVLPFTMEFISSNSSTITDFSSIQLLKDGTQDIKITSWQQKDTIILVKLGWDTIGKLFVNH